MVLTRDMQTADTESGRESERGSEGEWERERERGEKERE